MIPEQEVISFVHKHKNAFENIELSFFEWSVGLCFDYFEKEKVDIAIIETGLGGRLDSTNVVLPEISVITNISFDHVSLLGNTLVKIAAEKAGIIKEGVPVIIGEDDPQSTPVFLAQAEAKKSEIIFPSRTSRVTVKSETAFAQVLDIESSDGNDYPALSLDLIGRYQRKNILTVLSAVQQLQKQGWKISRENIYAALKNVSALTGLMGRWQRLREKPLTI
jgi:dihydrofolate synthase/folylpolyglutamate synthase